MLECWSQLQFILGFLLHSRTSVLPHSLASPQRFTFLMATDIIITIKAFRLIYIKPNEQSSPAKLGEEHQIINKWLVELSA